MDRQLEIHGFSTLAHSRRSTNSPLFSSLEELRDKLTELLGKSFNLSLRRGRKLLKVYSDLSISTKRNFLSNRETTSFSPWNNSVPTNIISKRVVDTPHAGGITRFCQVISPSYYYYANRSFAIRSQFAIALITLIIPYRKYLKLNTSIFLTGKHALTWAMYLFLHKSSWI